MSEEIEKRPTATQFTIKLYPDERERFKQLRDIMDNVRSDREALNALMDFYENPRTVEKIKDNPVLVQRVSDLEAEVESKANEIADLRSKLDQAKQDLNTNGETGTQLQLEIDRLKAENEALKAGEKHSPYYIGGELPPVPYFYASKMARLQSQKDKQERTPFWILANNFIQDLQNPLSNHLPIIVSSDELRAAQADYEKSLKKTEQKEEE